MRSITAGLCLCLLGSVASAQTPPSAAQLPKPPVPQPATPPADGTGQPKPSGSVNDRPQGRIMPGQGGPDSAMAVPGTGQNGQPEGEIIETPNGFYVVRPGRPGEQPGVGRNQPGVGGDQPGMMGGQPGAQPGAVNDGTMADDDMPPRPRRSPQPQGPMPEGKGARLRVHTPNLGIDVKCPDDESIKVCVDSVSQLLDKAAAQPHP